MKSDLEKKQLRTIQYWYVDGTFEFSMGGLCLLLAVYFYTLAKFEDTWLGGLLSALMVVLLVFGGLGINWLVMQMKERITFPRTGYVAYRRTSGTKRLVIRIGIGIISGLIAALLTLLLLRLSSSVMVSIAHSAPRPISWMPGITGLMFAGAISILGIRTAILRFYLAAALSLAVGVTLMFTGLAMNMGLAVFYATLAVGLLVIGGLTLRSYLSTTTPPAEVENE